MGASALDVPGDHLPRAMQALICMVSRRLLHVESSCDQLYDRLCSVRRNVDVERHLFLLLLLHASEFADLLDLEQITCQQTGPSPELATATPSSVLPCNLIHVCTHSSLSVI